MKVNGCLELFWIKSVNGERLYCIDFEKYKMMSELDIQFQNILG